VTNAVQRYKIRIILTKFVSLFAYFHTFYYFCRGLSADSSQIDSTNTINNANMSVPKFLPSILAISIHKGEFCYCTGLSPYKLKQVIKQHEQQLKRLGYSKYDKILMPNVTMYLLQVTGLAIDTDRLAECMGVFTR
jgi:hypothetical protein